MRDDIVTEDIGRSITVMEDVKVKDAVFKNNTWNIIGVTGEDGRNETYKGDFSINILQEAIIFLRNKT